MASAEGKTQQIKTLIGGLSMKKRLMIVGTALAIGAGILFNAWRSGADFHPLYTSLAAEDAGAIVQKLKEKGIPYRVSDNGSTVLVPSARVGEERLEMAAAGLPKTGRIGFELFDKTHFGATDFTEHINLQRALEGELERTISSMAEVETSRVHITLPKDSVFAENQLPAKASVMLKLRGPVTEQNVAAIRYLVSSAVEGLAADEVSVLDLKGAVLGRPKPKRLADGSEPSDALMEYKQQMEKNLLAKVNSTLEPLLGADKFRAQVVADCDITSGDQSEEVVDPTRTVITNEQHTKEVSNTGSNAGIPGTTSNLPRATPRPGTTTGVNKETANVTYQATRTVKRVHTPQGMIKRLSASVLVDQTSRWESAGGHMRQVLIPPSAEALQRISDVVSAAIGIDSERGDKLVVQTLPFEATLNQEPPPQPAPPASDWQKLSPTHIIALGVMVLLLAVIAWSSLRTASKNRRAVAVEEQAAIAAPPAQQQETAAQIVSPPQPAVVAAKLERQLEDQRRKRDEERNIQLEAAGIAIQQLTEDVKQLTAQDPSLCAGVLRGWLTEAETEAARK